MCGAANSQQPMTKYFQKMTDRETGAGKSINRIHYVSRKFEHAGQYAVLYYLLAKWHLTGL